MAKKRKKNTLGLKAVLLLLVIGAANYYLKSQDTEPTVPQTSVAVADSAAQPKPQDRTRAKGWEIPAYLTDRPEEIVQHESFTLSYNNKHLLPNWVAWVLTAERVKGTEKRADNFQPDTAIRRGPIATTYDYRASGYDRGHMCPAADCKHSRQAMNQCFLMSNMAPQTHALNAGDWADLEELCRRWATAYDSICIVCGPVLQKGARYEKIGENRVSVPRQFFKAVLRRDGEDAAEAIAFIFNNDEGKRPLSHYAVAVDSVESLTGINLFSKLPKHVEQRAEATFDISRWQRLR